jgi:peptidoglycan lytic transglycosylase G
MRRIVALALLGGGIAAAVWLVSLGLNRVGDDGSKTPTTSGLQVLKIVFPEGFTRKQMAERIVAVNAIAKERRDIDPRLSAKAYLAVTRSSLLPARFAGDKKRRILEGFLFPALYEFTPTTTSKRLVADQLRKFRREWKKVNLRYARSKNLTPYDVLMIASMIEAEVRAPEERALVAAVIYNRLKARMPLGIDATIRYALGVPATKSLTRAQLRNPTPYNTRIHRGLPPTPIGNPGLASIQAAAHPAKKDYLYFVRKPDKIHHFFTASYDEFVAYLKAHGYPLP